VQPSISLQFDGTCREAFDVYREHLGAKMVYMLTFGESPAGRDVPPQWQDKIVHASIDLNGLEIRGHDTPPGQYEAPQGVYILLRALVDATQGMYDALSDGGNILMPLGETFWSPSYGIVRDRFGILWKINGVA